MNLQIRKAERVDLNDSVTTIRRCTTQTFEELKGIGTTEGKRKRDEKHYGIGGGRQCKIPEISEIRLVRSRFVFCKPGGTAKLLRFFYWATREPPPYYLFKKKNFPVPTREASKLFDTGFWEKLRSCPFPLTRGNCIVL